MATRIDRRFAELKTAGRAALVTFLTAGDPDPKTSLALVRALPAAGADVIELGMPFTDPMADGPAIQMSSQRALKAGQTLKKTLELVRAYYRIKDYHVRRRIYELAKSLATTVVPLERMLDAYEEVVYRTTVTAIMTA